MNQPTTERFMSCSPGWYVRKATGEKVQAVESVTMWDLEEFKVGDFIVKDGERIYRCPPTRFWMIFEPTREVN